MNFSLQSDLLENKRAQLVPLTEKDFEKLYGVASDPKVWQNHPNKNRYQLPVFRNFFEGALQSGGAYYIIDKKGGEIAGSSRFYDYNENENSIFIGYTFFGTDFWGTGLNFAVKKLMLDYIFQYVGLVKFHVGAENFRSIKAMEKLNAQKVGEINIAYHGEPVRKNVEFHINREGWIKGL